MLLFYRIFLSGTIFIFHLYANCKVLIVNRFLNYNRFLILVSIYLIVRVDWISYQYFNYSFCFVSFLLHTECLSKLVNFTILGYVHYYLSCAECTLNTVNRRINPTKILDVNLILDVSHTGTYRFYFYKLAISN